MAAYAVGHLRRVAMGPAIAGYLAATDATLAPFGGRFVVHGGAAVALGSDWEGDLVVIGFPDRRGPRRGAPRPPTARSCRCASRTPPRR